MMGDDPVEDWKGEAGAIGELTDPASLNTPLTLVSSGDDLEAMCERWSPGSKSRCSKYGCADS